jgi:hypothetical protein
MKRKKWNLKRTRPPSNKKLRGGKGGYFTLDKQLLAKYGNEMAVFLTNIFDKYTYFKKRFPKYNGQFFLPHKDQIIQTGLSDHKIRKCKREAVLRGLFTLHYRGMPAREWYILNMEHSDIQQAMEILKDMSFKSSSAINNNIVINKELSSGTIPSGVVPSVLNQGKDNVPLVRKRKPKPIKYTCPVTDEDEDENGFGNSFDFFHDCKTCKLRTECKTEKDKDDEAYNRFLDNVD